MTQRFRGNESAGMELFGSISQARAERLVGKPMDFERVDADRVRASILTIQIDNLTVGGLPFARFTYPEVLWLLHLRSPEGGARVAVRAHVSARMVPALAIFDRYHTSTATIRIEPPQPGGNVSVHNAHHALAVSYTAGEDTVPPVIQRLWTRARNGSLYEIPWAPHAPERTQRITHRISDRSLVDQLFGPDFEFESNALYYWNRAHACSPAIRLRG